MIVEQPDPWLGCKRQQLFPTMEYEIQTMNQIIRVSNHLAIELLPSTDGRNPALRLFPPNDPEESFIVFLSEVHLLRDALALAGSRLTAIEQDKLKFIKTT
jgi:hypothetical protein